MVTLGGSHQRPSPPMTPTLLSSLLCCCFTGSRGLNSRRTGTQVGTELQTLRRAGPGCTWGQERRPVGTGARHAGGTALGGMTVSHRPTQDSSGVEGSPSSHGPGTGSKEQGCPRTAGDIAPWSLASVQSTLAFPWRLSAGGLTDQRSKGQGAGPGAMWGRGVLAARAPAPRSWG